MFRNLTSAGLVLGVLAGVSSLAQAAIVSGAKFFVIDPDVEITLTFLGGGGAQFTNQLFLSEPATPQVIFNNHNSVSDDISNQGAFAAGTELVFKMLSNTGAAENTFFSGPAARNADNFNHAIVDNAFNVAAGMVKVGFEDQVGGGDQDYGDMVFTLNNVRVEASPVPLPPALVLISSALFGLATRTRKRG